ncbi:MAG: 3'-5' exonuclease [Bacteroidota bacterium]|nr:3'-5' exonuclease [Bacteroidota bacterium]
MELKLKNPIVFFDLETTGLSITQDRIVEISLLKIFPNGNKESKTWLVNPTIPISEEAINIHKITNEKVENEPAFAKLAPEIMEIIKDSDLAGFNSNKFDIPLLTEEFLRAGIDIDMKKKHMIDVQNIFHKKEKRTLIAALKFYCNKNLDQAHSAEADTEATYEVLLAQLEKYPDLENNVDFLSQFSSQGDFVDMSGFVRYNDEKKEYLSFGKYKGKTLEEIWKQNPGYFSWFKQADFPQYTKNVMKNFINKMKLENKFPKE